MMIWQLLLSNYVNNNPKILGFLFVSCYNGYGSENMKINEQLLELNKYEEVVHHWADKMEPMDLDDGVKANYAKFQELLVKIK